MLFVCPPTPHLRSCTSVCQPGLCACVHALLIVSTCFICPCLFFHFSLFLPPSLSFVLVCKNWDELLWRLGYLSKKEVAKERNVVVRRHSRTMRWRLTERAGKACLHLCVPGLQTMKYINVSSFKNKKQKTLFYTNSQTYRQIFIYCTLCCSSMIALLHKKKKKSPVSS